MGLWECPVPALFNLVGPLGGVKRQWRERRGGRIAAICRLFLAGILVHMCVRNSGPVGATWGTKVDPIKSVG